MGKYSHWVGLAFLSLSLAGCALVGFDDEDGGTADGAVEDDGGVRGRMDAGGDRRDGAMPEDGGDAAQNADSGLDASDALDATDAQDAAVQDAAADDDAGEVCPASPLCEGTVYVECENGARRETDCRDKAGTCDVAHCTPDGCVVEDAPNGTACEDGKACTLKDTCQAGNCQSGTPRSCEALNSPCRLGVCTEDSGGMCIASPRNQSDDCGGGLTCDEGLCSSGDLCSGDVACTLSCAIASGPCRLGCNGSASCDFTCETGSICQFDCTGAGDKCNVTCATGSTCTVLCTTGTDCSNVTCAAGATCNLLCGGGSCG